MELGTALSHIEEIRFDIISRYNKLQALMKKNKAISDGDKKRAMDYATKVSQRADQHYANVTDKVTKLNQNNTLVKQIVSYIKSIHGYRDKIYTICDHEDRQYKE